MKRSQAVRWMAGAALLGALACSHSAPMREPVREPAAADALGIFKGTDTRLLGDFFQFDTRGKRARQEVQTRVWTDMDGEYLQGQARKALNEAVARTLQKRDAESGTGPEGTLISRLKGNLMESFLDEFIKTWRFYEIVNGTLQLDFYFSPEADAPTDYGPELGSNGLVRLNETGGLAAKLQEFEAQSFTRKVRAGARLIPPGRDAGGREGLRYIGGNITLNIQILDMGWKPLERFFPKSKKNAVKGFLRYRRYFAGAGAPLTSARCGQGTHQVKSAGYERGDSDDAFITVDVYHTFNLESLAPRPDRIEVFPGRILAPNRGEDALLPAGTEFTGKSVHAGDFVVKGETREPQSSIEFQHRLRGLVYSFESGQFDVRRSSLATTGRYLVTPPLTEEAAYANWSASAQGEFLKECREVLLKGFQLEQLSSHVTQGRVGQ
ncbi:MAG: hypothetical protein NDJ90_03260 [Oligoflexia bacterium]|nr:hypothetical protein [Oligoflexia bacterium]